MEENERPERLYQRILAHIQDNLLRKDGKLKHDGQQVNVDEDISPTVERLAVLRWLEVLDPDLPSHVSRTFAHDLQTHTLKDLQPQIVDALDSFLEEIRSKRVECARAFVPRGRTRAPQRHISRSSYASHPPSRSQNSQYSKRSSATPYCRVCKAESRPYNHTISSCDYMSRAEKKDIIHSFREAAEEGDSENDVELVQDDIQNLILEDNDA